MSTSTRLPWLVGTMIAALIAAALAASGERSQPQRLDDMCWRSLAPENGKQDGDLAIVRPLLVSGGPDDIWLTWSEGDSRLLRWFSGRWSQVSRPRRAGAGAMGSPMAVSASSGIVVMGMRADGGEGRSVLHVARTNGGAWEWTGPPLISSQEPFTHVHEASITIDGGQPVVAWCEERHVKPAGLFVARWDGSSWKRLGQLNPEGDDYYLSPSVVVDAQRQIWLAWREIGRGGLRVARWDGAAWREVGGGALRDLAAAGGEVTRELSLAVDDKGSAWVLWCASRDGVRNRSLALARWDGAKWVAITPPRSPAGKTDTVWSAAMILRGPAPLVAWSQSDATDNHHLYVSEWREGGQWISRLSDLHLVEGVSNVRDVSLAGNGGGSFFVSWDEPGQDERRTRLVEGYACAAGEAPAAPPKSIIERDTWPTTVDEAARRIVAELNEASKARLRATKKKDLIEFHFDWGMGIRNSYGLWRGNDKLLESCGHGKKVHPDDCSMVIIEAVWTILQKAPSPPRK